MQPLAYFIFLLFVGLIWLAIYTAGSLRQERRARTLLRQEAGHEITILRDRIVQLDDRGVRHDVTLESHESRLKSHDRAAGGFWLTAVKDLLRIRDMSTNHLRNSVDRGFAHGETLEKMEHEIARREEDARWVEKTKVADDFPRQLAASAALASIRRLATGIKSPAQGPLLAQVDNLEKALKDGPPGTIAYRAPYSRTAEHISAAEYIRRTQDAANRAPYSTWMEDKIKSANERGALLDQEFRKATAKAKRTRRAS